MKFKKVRGTNRRLRAIQTWVKNNKILNLELLEQQHREYVKFWVRPWSDFVIGNGYEPLKGQLKSTFLEGLQTIFRHWDLQLKTLNKPYYLKIWLFENQLERSQVVCAITDKINFYHNTFLKRPSSKSFESSSKNSGIQRFGNLVWEEYTEIDILPIDFRDSDLYKPIEESRIIGTYKIQNEDYYIFEKQKVWLGESEL
ncbi:hypothetical protein [Sphingobacterium bovistauri]|uniref:Uncharacterized protein n=1 Tax=Sphingobacterium bovistauri TaxID=2781959 RepID=A0ABS7Z8G7_9SPHI|nr:hypothetical protein [Sphingobacterium bovistauri]MCA5005244.1 hypothetical protein [Sphingobacterium bovistauri]